VEHAAITDAPLQARATLGPGEASEAVDALTAITLSPFSAPRLEHPRRQP